MEPVVKILQPMPPTTEGDDTTESSVSKTIEGSVSYTPSDGLGASVSESVEYEKSQSYSSPAIVTKNVAGEGPNGNNAGWTFDVNGSNAMTTTFLPEVGWFLEADSSTRAAGSIEVVSGISFTGYLISCDARTLERLPDPSDPSKGQLFQWNLKYPVPPLPPTN
jgi:hypothetical protein